MIGRVVSVVNNYTESSSKLDKTTELESLGLDSLDMVELHILLEEEFSIELEDDFLSTCSTLGDVAAGIKKRLS